MVRLKFISSVSKVGNGYYIRIPNHYITDAKKIHNKGKGNKIKLALDDEI